MISINLSADVAALTRRVDALAKTQIPFAAAQALNAVARKAVTAERMAMKASLDRPEPFTQRGVTMKGATKATGTAWVLILPLQARYLAPSIEGGKQVLNANRGVLDPVNLGLDAYGNIPRRRLAQLARRKDVFIGPVNGIHGVWQRLKGHKLRLLIRFADPKEVKARYRFGDATRAVAAREFKGELQAALARAIATAR